MLLCRNSNMSGSITVPWNSLRETAPTGPRSVRNIGYPSAKLTGPPWIAVQVVLLHEGVVAAAGCFSRQGHRPCCQPNRRQCLPPRRADVLARTDLANVSWVRVAPSPELRQSRFSGRHRYLIIYQPVAGGTFRVRYVTPPSSKGSAPDFQLPPGQTPAAGHRRLRRLPCRQLQCRRRKA